MTSHIKKMNLIKQTMLVEFTNLIKQRSNLEFYDDNGDFRDDDLSDNALIES